MEIIACSPKPRARVNDLLEIFRGMREFAIGMTLSSANGYLQKCPRYPKRITVDTSRLSAYEIELLGMVELISDEGLERLIQDAWDANKEFPKSSAEILKFKKPAARKSKRICK